MYTYVAIRMYVFLHLCMCTYIHSYLVVVHTCVCLPACLSVCLSVRLSVCLSISDACVHLGDTWSHIYLHNVEFDGSTGLSGSRLFGHAGCGEVNNNVNTSWHQDWIRQVCGIIVTF